MNKFLFCKGSTYIIKEQIHNQLSLKHWSKVNRQHQIFVSWSAWSHVSGICHCWSGKHHWNIFIHSFLPWMFTESFLAAGRTLWGTGRQFFQGILALRCHQLEPDKYPASTESCAVVDQAPVVRYKEEITTQTPKPSSTNSRKRKKRFHDQTIKEQVRKTWGLWN